MTYGLQTMTTMASFKPTPEQMAAVRAAYNPKKISAMPILPPKLDAETQPPANEAESYPSKTHAAWQHAIEEPAYLRDDPGLTCLISQLNRIDLQIRHHEYFKRSVDEAEEECKRELAASLARSLVSSSSSTSSNKQGGYEGGNGRKQPMGAASGSSLASGYSPDDSTSNYLNQWVKKWDPEVQAEYFFNLETGEASWLDPRYGMI